MNAAAAIARLQVLTKQHARFGIPDPLPEGEEALLKIFWSMFYKLAQEFGIEHPDAGMDPQHALHLVGSYFLDQRSWLKQLK